MYVSAMIMFVSLLALGVVLTRVKDLPPSIDKARQLMGLGAAGIAVASVTYFAVYFPTTELLSVSETSGVALLFAEDAGPQPAPDERLAKRVFAVNRAYERARSARMWFLCNGLLLFILPFGQALDVLRDLARREENEASVESSS